MTGNSLNSMLLLEVGRKINRRAAQEAPSPESGELPTWYENQQGN